MNNKSFSYGSKNSFICKVTYLNTFQQFIKGYLIFGIKFFQVGHLSYQPEGCNLLQLYTTQNNSKSNLNFYVMGKISCVQFHAPWQFQELDKGEAKI